MLESMIKMFQWRLEITQLLRVLAVLPEDLGSILSNHMAAHNCLQLRFQRLRHLHTDKCDM